MTAPASASVVDDVLSLYKRHVNRGMAKVLSLLGSQLEVSSSGCYVTDQTGDSYLDCGGYGVFLLGHCHPTVVVAVQEQLGRRPLATRMLLDETLAGAARALSAAAPAGMDYVLFTNSGAEAVEAALKLCRANGCAEVISTHGGFHGKTMGALSVTGRARYREPFAPLVPGVEFVPFDDLSALKASLEGRRERACVIVEPVQAEGGVRLPSEGYLRGVRQLCDERNAVLILDEIQTGLGRLGMWWGCEAEDVKPDLLLVGKILGGGVVPVGAVVARPELFEVMNRDPLLHSSTFAGNPLACVAATATLKVLEDEALIARAATLGETLLAGLTDIVVPASGAGVRAVRGRGLLLGVEFETPSAAVDFMAALLEKRVIVSYSLNAGNVLRLTPPAILGDQDVEWLFDALRSAVKELLTHNDRLSRPSIQKVSHDAALHD